MVAAGEFSSSYLLSVWIKNIKLQTMKGYIKDFTGATTTNFRMIFFPKVDRGR